jgi:uncharacterized tellurite resistance protein B-like protein
MLIIEQMEEPNKKITYKPAGEQEAWIGILFTCIASDGIVGIAEAESLSKMLSGKIIFEGTDIPALCSKVTDVYKESGAAGMIAACKTHIKEEDKPTLFSMAVDIVLSDGLLEKEERQIIELLASELKIESSLLLKIVEVMLIRNRGNRILD